MQYVVPLLSLFFVGCSAFEKDYTGPRVAVIGVDGLSWSHVDPLIAAGKLTAFAQVRNKGASADLQIDSSLSPVSWTTLASGRHPAEHGVADQQERGATFGIDASAVKVKRLWDIASEQGRRTLVAGWWLTSPAYPINGVMISQDAQTRWPADLSFPPTNPLDPAPELLPEMVRLGITYSMGREVSPLLDQATPGFDLVMLPYYPWDAAMHQIYVSYQVGCDPSKLASAPADVQPRLSSACAIGSETLRIADLLLQRALRYVGDDGYVVLISDHGHRRAQTPVRRIAINRKVLDGGQGTIERGTLQIGGSQIFISEQRQQSHASDIHLYYQLTTPRLQIVGPEAPAIQSRLLSLTDAAGRPMFTAAADGSLGISDAIITFADQVLGQYISDSYSVFVNTGEHGMQDPGIFGVYGPGVKAGPLSSKVETVDITPTALWLLGMPVAEDMDGKVVTDAFNSAHISAHPIARIPTWEDGTRPWATPGNSTNLTDAERERLKVLGYIQ